MGVDVNVVLTMREPILGTQPLDPTIWDQYISQGLVDEEETRPEAGDIEAEEEAAKKIPISGFHREKDNGQVGVRYLYDYQIKGFFKDACGCLRRVPGTGSSKLKAYKKVIDGIIFVKPRRIALEMPEGGEVTILKRSLRVPTPKGDRTAIVASEALPAGTKVRFTVMLLDKGHDGLLQEWLAYGKQRGLGQWRNAGYGSFDYESPEID